MATAMENSPKSGNSRSIGLSTYILVACVAGSSLGLELIQTRILSFLYYNHVAYITVTVALLDLEFPECWLACFHPEVCIPSE